MASRRIAWLDLAAGVSGDMLLGAFLDAGANLQTVCRSVESVLPGAVEIAAREQTRAAMRALTVAVTPLAADQPHRAWAEIRGLLAGPGGLDPRVRELSLTAFARLAEAEARVHRIRPEEVHFHEVGAWDSVADVVGTCAAYVDLGVDLLVASPVEVGSGTVATAHGRLPVPAPAVAELLAGWPITGERQGECATPTGAALVRVLAARFGPLPPMRLRRTGVGAGSRDTSDRPNVVRVLVGESGTGDEHAGRPVLTLVETNVDDLDPRLWPGVIDATLAAGAADAWLTPIVMKKGRPAHTLSVLCPNEISEAIVDLVLGRTSTLGVRVSEVQRPELDRIWATVLVDGRPVRIKAGLREGRIVHATPEFADIEAAAAASDRPAADVLDAARAVARAAGIVPGAVPPAPADEG